MENWRNTWTGVAAKLHDEWVVCLFVDMDVYMGGSEILYCIGGVFLSGRQLRKFLQKYLRWDNFHLWESYTRVDKYYA